MNQSLFPAIKEEISEDDTQIELLNMTSICCAKTQNTTTKSHSNKKQSIFS